MTLHNIDTLKKEDLARICDCSFLARPESFEHLADKNKSAMYIYDQAFYAFMEQTITSRLYPFGIRVHPENILRVNTYLECAKISDINVIGVVGFPFGSLTTTEKLNGLRSVIERGGDEAEIVMNYEMFKGYPHVSENKKNYVHEEMLVTMVEADSHSLYLTYILETSKLTKNELGWACNQAFNSNIDFVSASTGFTSRGASVKDLEIMRTFFDEGIKISGNVTPENFRYLLKAAAGDINGFMELDPSIVRISENGLLNKID